MDYLTYNRQAWDRQVRRGNRWTIPVSPEEISRARRGEISVVLTPTKPVPKGWFGDLRGKHVLGLASGGGQQVPSWRRRAEVTSYDNSPRNWTEIGKSSRKRACQFKRFWATWGG